MFSEFCHNSWRNIPLSQKTENLKLIEKIISLKGNSCKILYCIIAALDNVFHKVYTPEDIIEQLYHSALDTRLVIVSSSQKLFLNFNVDDVTV